MLDSAVLQGKKKKAKKITIVDIGKSSFKVRKGLLHKHLNIPVGQKIPVARLHEALKSKSKAVRDEARSAIGLEAMAKK